jgi:U2 small nuclear ribonucleoprotein B''
MAEISAPPVQINMESVIAAPVPLDAAAAPTAVPIVSPPPGIETKPEIASETLYIQNLNERIRPHGMSFFFKKKKFRLLNTHFMDYPSVMKQTLRGLFKNYGDVLDVVAHSNLRMRGQAFVSFADIEIAKKACKEVKGFPLYSKPMACSHAQSASRFSTAHTPPPQTSM